MTTEDYRQAVSTRIVIVVIAAVLLAVGVSALVTPDMLAKGFGIPIDTAASRAYAIAAGTRDIAMGCWLFALVWFRASKQVLAASIFAMAFVAIGDAANVYLHVGISRSITLAGHVGSACGLLAVGAWLWRRRER